jgi:hypothetical protein
MAGALAAAALLASAAPALAQSLSVSPASVAPGASVTVSGNVGSGCMHGDQVTVISGAFGGTQEFAGVPAVFTNSDSAGAFSASAPIPATRAPGNYSVSARCGGGRFGDATISVTSAGAGGGTLPRTGFTLWILVGLGLAMVLSGAAARRGLA